VSYEPELTDVAIEDLHALIDSLPAARRRDAWIGVEAAFEQLAANPLLAQQQHLGRLAYQFQFHAEGVAHHWACTFVYAEDEARIKITHVYRVAM
jgi:hypothetical protein